MLSTQTTRYPLGQYLLAAGLLSSRNIDMILRTQQRTGDKFGAIAVLFGLIKPGTLDYFIQTLFPEHEVQDPSVHLEKQTLIQSLIDIRFEEGVLNDIDLKKSWN